MAEARIAAAMGRIEAALARIERAPARAEGNAAPANAKLVDRHEALREVVSSSLADLDRLIAELEP